MRHQRRLTVVVAALVSLLLAGCGGAEEEPGPGQGKGVPQQGGSDDDPPATLPPEFLECGDPDSLDPDRGLMLAELDLTSARWSTPEGFTETFSYYEDNPVENLVDLWVAEPQNDPVILNVVNVAIYDGLDWAEAANPCGRVPLDAVEDRLAGYREQIDAQELAEAEMTHIAGHPAITQQLSLADYDYVGYWLFSKDQLLHLYCQWTTERDTIETACEELVDSLQVD